MIPIPSQDKKLLQTNRSNILGNLWASFNLDLQSNLGAIRLSPRLLLQTGGVTNQGLSAAFCGFDERIYTLAGTRIFKNSAYNLVSAFTEDASTGAVTTYDPLWSDMTVASTAGSLVATSKTAVMAKVMDGAGAGAWSSKATISDNSLHKLHYFRKQDRTYYFDAGNQIKSLDSTLANEATSGSYFFNVNSVYGTIYTMESDNDYIWIGTVNPPNSLKFNGMDGCYILKWDGATASSVSAAYKIKAQGILAMSKDENNIIHAITTDGAILEFNGGGFVEIGRLPLNKDYLVFSPSTSVTVSSVANSYATPAYGGSFIHPNGLYYTKNGTFVALINNLVGNSAGSIKENLPSGIWEFSKDTGFVHRQSLTYTPFGTTTITDYGQNRVSDVGALYAPNIYSNSASGKPTLICGATYYTNGTSTATGIFVDDPNDTIQKFGYFATTWLESSEVKDTWKKVWAKFRQFLDSADKIIVKYRTTEAVSVELSGTWIDTGSFVTTTDISAYSGYEVEITQGTGSGKCAHITQVYTGGGNYTAILDEVFTGVTTGTMKFRVQNWTKAGSYSAQTSEVESFSMKGVVAPRAQVKVCLQFTGEDECRGIVVINDPYQAAV